MFIKKNTCFLMPVIIVGAILAVLLNPHSNDYISYHMMYIFPDMEAGTQRIEPGFKLINYICRKIGMSYDFYWFMLCFITLSIKIHVLSKTNVRHDILLLLILSYFLSLFILHETTQIRAALAIAFGYLAILNRSSMIKYIICLCIACTFHYSAVIFLPCTIFLSLLKFNKIKNFTFLAALSIFLPIIMMAISALLGKLNPLFLLYYTNSSEVNTSSVSLTFILAVLFVFMNLLTLYSCEVGKDLNLHVGLFSLGVIILYSLHFAPVLSLRVYELFSFSAFIIVAMLYSNDHGYIKIPRYKRVFNIYRLLTLISLILISVHRFIAYIFVNPIIHF